MTTTTYAADLGKCYNKTEDGRFRLYKVDNAWTIYLVSKELIWGADHSITWGTRLEATFLGYISEPENFDIGVYEVECELRAMAADD
jgi:hypothetical protein